MMREVGRMGGSRRLSREVALRRLTQSGRDPRYAAPRRQPSAAAEIWGFYKSLAFLSRNLIFRS